MQSEKADLEKNMIDMKSVVKTVIVTTLAFISLGLIQFFIGERQFLFRCIVLVSLFTAYLANFARSPQIREFFFRKLTQKRIYWNENLVVLKSKIRILRANKVSVLRNDNQES